MSQYQSNMGFDDFSSFFTFHFHKPSQISLNYSQLQKQTPFIQQQSNQEMQQKTADKDANNQMRGYDQNHFIMVQKQYQILYDVEILKKNVKVRIGSKNDTVLLNINFKTILCNYFKQLLFANQLSNHSAELFRQFRSRSPSFQSFLKFCSIAAGGEQINRFCLKLVQSSQIIRKIFKSKCNIRTKLQMIKFIEVLRENIKGEGEIKKWKHKVRKINVSS